MLEKLMPVDVATDEDDDFLSFMKTDEHIEKEMSLEDKVCKFISVTYNKNINSDSISDYLYKPLNEII